MELDETKVRAPLIEKHSNNIIDMRNAENEPAIRQSNKIERNTKATWT